MPTFSEGRKRYQKDAEVTSMMQKLSAGCKSDHQLGTKGIGRMQKAYQRMNSCWSQMVTAGKSQAVATDDACCA
eukprot:5787487-Pleurochrysis_carterae.AAC.2